MKSYSRFLFPISIFFLVLFFFKNAFSMSFFRDDFFFLNISKAKNISDVLHFFSPIRTYFYRPLSSEFFYFLIRDVPILGKIIVFTIFFVGLFFLYKGILFCFRNKSQAKLSVFMYSISFIHVFQLYWFATFQEVLLFFGLTGSFLFFLRKQYAVSIFFYILALLSKETAILYIVFLTVYTVFLYTKKNTNKLFITTRIVLLYGLLSIFFCYLYHFGLTHVTQHDNYRIQFNLKLLINKSMWYSLWSLGFPSFLPDYMRSIFSVPLPTLWDNFRNVDSQIYLITFVFYILCFLISVIYLLLDTTNREKLLSISLILICCYIIFLGPILFFTHRWMVRLMIPLIFISAIQGYVLFTLFSIKTTLSHALFYVLICLYVIYNYFGTQTHENTSMYKLETRIVSHITEEINKNRLRIEVSNSLYFKNGGVGRNDCIVWGGCSKKIENTLFGSSFLTYFFPSSSHLKVYYEWNTPNLPHNSFVIDSASLIY